MKMSALTKVARLAAYELILAADLKHQKVCGFVVSFA